MKSFCARFGLNYLWGVINFAAGAILSAILSFTILASIWHAGVCR